jgi:hypothetical protein
MMNILHRPANLFVQNIAAHATGALLVATSAFIFSSFSWPNPNQFSLASVTALGFGIAVCCTLSLGWNLRSRIIFLVGSNNHRQFVLFITTLVIGIVLFDYLTYACMSPHPAHHLS